jgi:POT family proton-dependent oligopeptide transporter
VKSQGGFFSQLNELRQGSFSYWLVNLVNFTDGIAYFGILGLLVLYLTQNLGVSDSAASPMVSFFTGGVTLFMLIGGGLTDRFGVRNALTLALLLGTLGRCGLWLAGGLSSVGLALGSLGVMAMATGVLQPALYAGVKRTTPTHLASMGFSLLYSLMNLGSMAECYLSPWLRTETDLWGFPGLNLGIRGVFGCMAAITLAQLVTHLLLFPKDAPALSQQEKQAGGGVWRALRDLPFLYFIFILVPVRTLFAHQWLTIPIYATRCFGEGISHRLEWLSMLNGGLVMLAVPICTHLTRRVPVLWMMIIGTAVSAGATFLLVLPPEASRLILYVVIFSLGESLWSSRFLEYVAELAPPSEVGAYMGLANLPWFIAKTTTGFYAGLMIAKYVPAEGPQQPTTLWFIYALVACLSPLGLLLASGWLQKSMSAAVNHTDLEEPAIGINREGV